MSIIATAVFTMLISVPPPDYPTPIIVGPQLFCGETFSFRLHEGETVSIPWQGTVRQAGYTAYYSAETRAGRINIYERRIDRSLIPDDGYLSVEGGRFRFRHQGEYDDGSNIHSEVSFRTGNNEMETEVVFDFIASKRDEDRENEVLLRVGRPPLDSAVCGAVG